MVEATDGVFTDRDIAARVVAQGEGPDTPVREAMSTPAVTVLPDMSIDDCCRVMEQNHIRRVPVVDGGGGCCGIVPQVDLARQESEHMASELVRDAERTCFGGENLNGRGRASIR